MLILRYFRASIVHPEIIFVVKKNLNKKAFKHFLAQRLVHLMTILMPALKLFKIVPVKGSLKSKRTSSNYDFTAKNFTAKFTAL